MSFSTRVEYNEKLKRSLAASNDVGMQQSLQAWISACAPLENGSTATQRMPLSRVIDDAHDRIIYVSTRNSLAPLERNGFPLRDTPLVAVDLSDCTILRGSTVIFDNKIFPKDFRSAPGGWKDIGWYMHAIDIGFVDYDICTNTALPDYYVQPGTEALPDSREYFFFASNYSGSNFGHFMHDTMAQLMAYERICEIRGKKLVPILARQFQFPMQRFLFEKLICPPSEAIYLPRHPIFVGKCFGATIPMPNPREGEVAVDALRHLRRRIQEVRQSLGIDGALSIPKIYISRSDATGTGRKFFNLSETEFFLRKKDFAFVTVSKLKPEHLFSVFDDCATVIGVHGAGLLNVFLARNDAKTVELGDYPNSWESIPTILLGAGFDHFRVAPRPPCQNSQNLPALNIDEISRIL